jgi:metal-responsive CopG/Arc/MetJ family transcriptional regulator
MAKDVRVSVRLPAQTLKRIDQLTQSDQELSESNRSRTVRALIERGLETTHRGDAPPTIRRRA